MADNSFSESMIRALPATEAVKAALNALDNPVPSAAPAGPVAIPDGVAPVSGTVITTIVGSPAARKRSTCADSSNAACAIFAAATSGVIAPTPTAPPWAKMSLAPPHRMIRSFAFKLGLAASRRSTCVTIGVVVTPPARLLPLPLGSVTREPPSAKLVPPRFTVGIAAKGTPL